MQQLASFEPDDESNFDNEVEEFRRKLEQAYRLCPRCERQLRRTLNRVKQTVLGSKLAQIGAHGLRAFDLHMSATNQLLLAKRKRRLTRLFGATLMVLSVVNLIRTTRAVRITRTALNLVFPASVSSVLLVTYACMAICTKYAWKAFDYATESIWSVQWIGNNWEYVSSYLGIKELEKLAREQPPVLDMDTLNTEQLASVSAIMLCIFVVWLNKCRRSSVLMLLAWSVKCALPSATIGIRSVSSMESAAYLIVIFDILQLLIDLLVLGSSSQDAFSRTDRLKFHNQSANSSFHRIYADSDDLSDHSDNETVFSSSSSFRKNHTPRTPFNASINTTRSISPSVFTPSTLRATHSSMNSLNRSFCNDIRRSSSNFQSSHQNLNTLYDVPEDFQSGITQLNISDKYSCLRPQSTCDSFATAPSQSFPFGPYEVSQQPPLRYRSGSASIIGPSRLQHSSDNNTSWLAGGYWNASASPTKRTATTHPASSSSTSHFAPPPQLTSRTSSQSSGFESRESSISPAINPSDSVSQCGIESPIVRQSSSGSGFYGLHPQTRPVTALGPSSMASSWNPALTESTVVSSRQQKHRFRGGTELGFPIKTPSMMMAPAAYERGSLLKAWTQRNGGSISHVDVRQS